MRSLLFFLVVMLFMPVDVSARPAHEPPGQAAEQPPRHYAESTQRSAVKATSFAQAAETAEEQRRLGLSYETGEGIERDYAEALYWYRRAADQGDMEAKFRLGLLFGDGGYGIDKDPRKATRWFLDAAERGHAAAQVNLAFRYQSDWTDDPRERGGITPNDETAAYWYRRAADQGLALAQRNLGTLYASGKGVPQDWGRAYFWYGLALKQTTNVNIAAAAEAALGHLSSEERDRIDKEVEAWRPTAPDPVPGNPRK